MVVPARLTYEAANQLREGIDLVLGRWTALQMAIHNEWGGRDTRQKAQGFNVDVYHWLSRPSGINLLLLHNFYRYCHNEALSSANSIWLHVFRECPDMRLNRLFGIIKLECLVYVQDY